MYMELFTGAFLVAQVSLIIVAKPFYAIFCTSCVLSSSFYFTLHSTSIKIKPNKGKRINFIIPLFSKEKYGNPLVIY